MIPIFFYESDFSGTHLQWTAMGPGKLASTLWARACSTKSNKPVVALGTSGEPWPGLGLRGLWGASPQPE